MEEEDSQPVFSIRKPSKSKSKSSRKSTTLSSTSTSLSTLDQNGLPKPSSSSSKTANNNDLDDDIKSQNNGGGDDEEDEGNIAIISSRLKKGKSKGSSSGNSSSKINKKGKSSLGGGSGGASRLSLGGMEDEEGDERMTNGDTSPGSGKGKPKGPSRLRRPDSSGSLSGLNASSSRSPLSSSSYHPHSHSPSKPSPLNPYSSTTSTLPTTTSTSRPTYSQDYLAKLRAENAVTNGSPPVDSSSVGWIGNGEDYDDDDEDGDFNNDEMTKKKFGTSGTGGKGKIGVRSVNDEDDLGGMVGRMELDRGDSSIPTSTTIPTTNHISSIKSKRDQLRRSGVLPNNNNIPNTSSGSSSEFISLNDNNNERGMTLRSDGGMEIGNYDGPSKSGGSRLVREEDEVGDGGDDNAEFTDANVMIPLGRRARKEAEQVRKRGMKVLIDEMEEEDESDEEAKAWEAEQARRGEEGTRKRRREEPEKKGYVPAPIPEPTPLPTLSKVHTRLHSHLTSLRSDHSTHLENLSQSERSRIHLEEEELRLKGEVERVSKKKEWFESMKEFIEDLVGMIEEKSKGLEKIEKDNLAIQRERTEIVWKRRWEDDGDFVALFTGEEVGMRYPKGIARRDNKGKARQDDDGDGGSSNSNDEDEDEDMTTVDELGRERRENDRAPRSYVRTLRREERLKRRRLRKETQKKSGILASSAMTTGNDGDDDEGFSTDDELSTAMVGDLEDAIRSLESGKRKIFKDVVVEEFRDPEWEPTKEQQEDLTNGDNNNIDNTTNVGIRRRFEQWRNLYRIDYDRAFGGLGLVGVWEFWARWEMADWNPFGLKELKEGGGGAGGSLDEFGWHKGLEGYMHPSRKTKDMGMGMDVDMDQENEEEEDPSESEDLISALITSVVIPKVEKFAEVVYDPYSEGQTRKAVGCVEEIGYGLEEGSMAREAVIIAFLRRLATSIHLLQLLILPHLSSISSPNSLLSPEALQSRNIFLRRRLKLLRNCLKWRRLARGVRIPSAVGDEGEIRVGTGLGLEELLKRELVGKVIVPVLEAAWETGGREIALKIKHITPHDLNFLPQSLVDRL